MNFWKQKAVDAVVLIPLGILVGVIEAFSTEGLTRCILLGMIVGIAYPLGKKFGSKYD